MSFTHLHVHSHYSLLDGLSKIDELVKKAKEDGCEALALTDHGVMYGIIEFYQKCKKEGIKPIIGVEAYLTPGSRLDKVLKPDEKNYHHILLLAKNNTGYKNLLKITSIAHIEGFYYKPRIDWETLEKYHEGVIAGSACLGGEIPRLIISEKYEKAKERILAYNNLFGQGNFYLELQEHLDIPEQEKVNNKLIEFSKELNIPLIATNDAHYLNKDDDEAQDILLCLQNKSKREDTRRMSMIGGNYSLRSRSEMEKSFSYIPEALENTGKIADMCNVEIELGNIQLPYFEVPDGYDGNSYLRKLSLDGLVKRYGKTYEEIEPIYRERLDYELSVVAKMGWPSYFLIVADFVNWSKNNKIVVGPGRGSAAGSLVCYLIGITNLCPIKYDLLFERFLNPDRISMPDIDMDFADIRRDEVIKYVQDKYGEDHVAQIITFGTMAARAAVRDVGRVLDYPYDYCDKLAKMIPPMTKKLKDAIENVPELREIYKEEAARNILDYALKLEGVARHSSIHACGILITKDPLSENVPVQYASSSDKTVVSQYSLHPIEDLGLLKMDFLGLKNLTIIESAIRIIKNTRGLEIDIDNIPLGDQKAFDLFQKGSTTGVFQFESSGMKRYLRELKANDIEDIIAMVALYRPGPMEWIPDYINGKHGKKKIVYLHPKLEPILKKTYGVAIYQEQVMQMARDLAGFSMGEADVLRKAMGKKIVKLLAEQKEKFIDGCVKNSISSELAEKIFSFIEPFAGYGFNRSHAACYAMVAYQTAYLKANWPAEFMAALLTSDQQDTDRIAIEIDECRRMGIEVKQPDINQSYESFTVVTSGTENNEKAKDDENVNTIRFGLKAIKNVGEHISEIIIEERKNNGMFSDISDLLERVDDKDLNKKSLESLIKSGAMDNLGERGELLSNVELMLTFHKEINKDKNSNQISLFSNNVNLNVKNKIKLKPSEPAKRLEKLAWEKELLGLYITEHPFSDFKRYLAGYAKSLSEARKSREEDEIVVAGIIVSIKKILTRKNENMIFVKIEDGIDNVEILVFPKVYQDTMAIWQEGKTIICQGSVSLKDGETKILVNKAGQLNIETVSLDIDNFKKIEVKKRKTFVKNDFNGGYNNNNGGVRLSDIKEAKKINHPPLKLIINQNNLTIESLNKLKEVLANYIGESKVYLKIVNGDQFKIIEIEKMVVNSQDLKNNLLNIFGDTIKIVDN